MIDVKIITINERPPSSATCTSNVNIQHITVISQFDGQDIIPRPLFLERVPPKTRGVSIEIESIFSIKLMRRAFLKKILKEYNVNTHN